MIFRDVGQDALCDVGQDALVYLVLAEYASYSSRLRLRKLFLAIWKASKPLPY
jgi:hypothetical protein